MDKRKGIFVKEYRQRILLPWYDGGKIFSVKEEEIPFPSGITEEDKIDIIMYREKISGGKTPKTNHYLYIHKTKLAQINNLEILRSEFNLFGYQKTPYTFDIFITLQIRRYLKNLIDRRTFSSETFCLMGSFDKVIILRNVLIPFFNRPTDEVVKTTPEQWEAVITEIKLLML